MNKIDYSNPYLDRRKLNLNVRRRFGFFSIAFSFLVGFMAHYLISDDGGKFNVIEVRAEYNALLNVVESLDDTTYCRRYNLNCYKIDKVGDRPDLGILNKYLDPLFYSAMQQTTGTVTYYENIFSDIHPAGERSSRFSPLSYAFKYNADKKYGLLIVRQSEYKNEQ